MREKLQVSSNLSTCWATEAEREKHKITAQNEGSTDFSSMLRNENLVQRLIESSIQATAMQPSLEKVRESASVCTGRVSALLEIVSIRLGA